MTLLSHARIPTRQAKHGFENGILGNGKPRTLSNFEQKTSRLSCPQSVQLHARPTVTLLLDPYTRSIVAWHIR